MNGDTRNELLKQWAAGVIQAAQAGAFGGRPVQVLRIETVRGPRAGALEIHAALDSGRFLRTLQADEHALHRQFIPWPFTGEPSAYMAGRFVRLEAGWPDELAEKSIKLSEIGAHPKDGGRWIAGKNEGGATITLGLDTSPHWLIGGWTGSGKTYALRSCLAQLAGDPSNRLLLIDAKYGDGLGVLGHLPNLVGPVATDVESAKAALGWAVTEMKRRYETSDRSTRLIICIDEVQELTGRGGDAGIVEMIRRLVAQGRGARVHVLIGTQHPVNEVFSDPTIRRNLTGRLALRTADYKASETIVGGPTPRADRLLGAGDAYAIANGAVHRAQLAYIPPQELGKISGGRPVMDVWPVYNAEAMGNLPQAVGAFSGTELGVSLVTAHVDKGRPFLIEALQVAGLAKPGSDRASRLLALGRDEYEWLCAQGFTLCEKSA